MSRNTVKPALTRNRRTRRPARRFYRAVVLLLRFVSGRPLDGRRHSNATFWQPGNRRVGHPAYLITWRWWALAAGWQRAAVRLGTLAVVALLIAVVISR
ncbi:MAG TPA: hypothetical protein VF657_10570 [Actinoplanes sp.]|jgi:hypothetical protein